MARLVLCVLSLLVATGLASNAVQKPADPALLQKQLDLMMLFYHMHEPIQIESQKTIASTWDIEKNLDKFTDVNTVKIYLDMLEIGLLPRGVPFAVLEHTSKYEAMTLFKVLFSAKDYDTFYKTAVYLRDKVNEELYSYVLSVAITHRPDTQGVILPPIYEIFPYYFHNAAIINEAKRLKTHEYQNLDFYKTAFKWNDNLVVRWNYTTWPYWSENMPVTYYTHDPALNALYYNVHVTYPQWLGGEVFPLAKDKRGEWFWFIHKQILTRYYMERLSNGMDEIPILGIKHVEQGFTSGLAYGNGMPFPERGNNFDLQKSELAVEFEQMWTYEYRIYEAIDKGYFINKAGERMSLIKPEDIDVLGNLIESNVDSPNRRFFKDVITLWKKMLGPSATKSKGYFNQDLPLTLPSSLENYQTAFRDPAFYMIWKRIMNIFNYWHRQLPLYKREELVLPTVAIQKVETDKLQTYFEQTYYNISNVLPLNDYERKVVALNCGVLVQRPQLNHKEFEVRVRVKSETAKKVVVKFFLAPKYDSKGMEIPLHLNTENFFQLDYFIYDLPAGETVIKRTSSKFHNTIQDWDSSYEVYEKTEEALKSKGQFSFDYTKKFDGLPNRLILPKGRVGGMPFVFMVYISEYHAPKVSYGTGFDPTLSLGLGTGARNQIDEPLGFPVNRPIYKWQIQDAKNIWFQDVLIYHKHTPELFVPHAE